MVERWPHGSTLATSGGQDAYRRIVLHDRGRPLHRAILDARFQCGFLGRGAGPRPRRPVVMTHAMLLAATRARDVDGDGVWLRIEAVQAGRLERWTGSRCAPLSLRVEIMSAAFGGLDWARVLGPGDRIRWIPPAGASGTVAAFAVRVNDRSLKSEVVSQVSIRIPS